MRRDEKVVPMVRARDADEASRRLRLVPEKQLCLQPAHAALGRALVDMQPVGRVLRPPRRLELRRPEGDRPVERHEQRHAAATAPRRLERRANGRREPRAPHELAVADVAPRYEPQVRRPDAVGLLAAPCVRLAAHHPARLLEVRPQQPSHLAQLGALHRAAHDHEALGEQVVAQRRVERREARRRQRDDGCSRRPSERPSAAGGCRVRQRSLNLMVKLPQHQAAVADRQSAG
eukprot:2386676-Prymnesium_polylepis.1